MRVCEVEAFIRKNDISGLMRALNGSGYEGRLAAIQALGKIGDESVIPDLLLLTTNPNPIIKKNSQAALLSVIARQKSRNINVKLSPVKSFKKDNARKNYDRHQNKKIEDSDHKEHKYMEITEAIINLERHSEKYPKLKIYKDQTEYIKALKNDGFVLNTNVNSSEYSVFLVHSTDCETLKGSYTHSPKIYSESCKAIRTWAEENKINIRPCERCIVRWDRYYSCFNPNG